MLKCLTVWEKDGSFNEQLHPTLFAIIGHLHLAVEKIHTLLVSKEYCKGPKSALYLKECLVLIRAMKIQRLLIHRVSELIIEGPFLA